MNSRIFQAQMILSAVDNATRVVNSVVNKAVAKLNELSKKSEEISKRATNFARDTAVMGGATAAGLLPAINAYAELEDSTVRLETVMMRSNTQLSNNFGEINNLANQLGTQLPGTTADFQDMISVLLQLGVSEKSILGGVGRSAAYLGVALQMPYEQAAEAAGKLKNATGVADSEMMAFLDTMARLRNLNVDTTQMQYAFSKSSGALKILKLQGLDASKEVGVLYAQLLGLGHTGETVGTNMNRVFLSLLDEGKMGDFNAATNALGLSLEFFDKKTKAFKGIPNMIQEFEKLKAIKDDSKRLSVVQSLLGDGADANFVLSIIDMGIAKNKQMKTQLNSQADLNTKVSLQLKTLKNEWEAATGTFTNTIAKFAGTFAPTLKGMAKSFNTLSESLGKWIDKNPAFARAIGLTAIGFIGLMAVLASVGIAVAGFTKVLSYMLLGKAKLILFFKAIINGFSSLIRFFVMASRFLLANPILLAIALIATAAFLIYKYWDKIAPFFRKVWASVLSGTRSVWGAISRFFRAVWAGIRSVFNSGVAFIKKIFLNYTPLGIIINNWVPIRNFFSNLWQSVKNIFSNFVNWLKGLGTTFYNSGVNIVDSIWKGIKAMVNKPIKAVKDMVKEIRSYLPFSPAKKGPLMDIHRIKLVETIASNIKPTSMISAMKNTAMVAFRAVPKLFQPVSNFVSNFIGGGNNKTKPQINPTRGSGGQVSVVYSPVITINGEASSSNFAKVLKENAKEIARIVQKEMNNTNRKTF